MVVRLFLRGPIYNDNIAPLNDLCLDGARDAEVVLYTFVLISKAVDVKEEDALVGSQT